MTPEAKARQQIDERLTQAGWVVQDMKQLNLGAALGVAVREFPTDTGPADYALFVDREAVGVIEAKRDDVAGNITVVEDQTQRYAHATLNWRVETVPLPFLFESTAQIIRFTDGRDPAARSREIFHFFRPEQLKKWLGEPDTLRCRPLQNMPVLPTRNLRDCQVRSAADGKASKNGALQPGHSCRDLRLHRHRRVPPQHLQLWKQGARLFDAFLVGLTATPDKRTFGFFNENIVAEYTYEQSVADGVNVGYDVYLIETEISQNGAELKAREGVDHRDRQTRTKRWAETEDDNLYTARELDRSVVNKSQISSGDPGDEDGGGNADLPDPQGEPEDADLCQDDSHADDIIHILREVYGQGNALCKKVTYKSEDDPGGQNCLSPGRHPRAERWRGCRRRRARRCPHRSSSQVQCSTLYGT